MFLYMRVELFTAIKKTLYNYRDNTGNPVFFDNVGF